LRTSAGVPSIRFAVDASGSRPRGVDVDADPADAQAEAEPLVDAGLAAQQTVSLAVLLGLGEVTLDQPAQDAWWRAVSATAPRPPWRR